MLSCWCPCSTACEWRVIKRMRMKKCCPSFIRWTHCVHFATWIPPRTTRTDAHTMRANKLKQSHTMPNLDCRRRRRRLRGGKKQQNERSTNKNRIVPFVWMQSIEWNRISVGIRFERFVSIHSLPLSLSRCLSFPLSQSFDRFLIRLHAIEFCAELTHDELKQNEREWQEVERGAVRNGQNNI